MSRKVNPKGDEFGCFSGVVLFCFARGTRSGILGIVNIKEYTPAKAFLVSEHSTNRIIYFFATWIMRGLSLWRESNGK
jgi:hypothetical protein